MNTLQSTASRNDTASLAQLRAPVIRFLRTMRDEALAIRDRQSPSAFPHVQDLECFCENRRASRPGGDFFDLVSPNHEELTVGVGTLSVRGIAGPILMSGLQATLHSLGARGSELPGILEELNRIMWNIAPDRTFASLFCARIVPRSGHVHYVNAGHETALMIRPDQSIERLEPHAPVLGLSRRSQYHHRTVRFGPGDTLIALTEGSEAGTGKALRDPVRFRDLPARIIDAAESLSGLHKSDRTVVVVHHSRLMAAAA